MRRRTLVQLSAAAILLPTAAFAQSSQTSVSLEAKHAADTLEAGAVALETSRVALSKATEFSHRCSTIKKTFGEC